MMTPSSSSAAVAQCVSVIPSTIMTAILPTKRASAHAYSAVERLHDLGARHQVGGTAGKDDLAAVDGIEPVRDAPGVLHVRLRDEHGDAERLDRAYGVDEPRHHHRRQSLERLVEEE